jgi:tetratricopeptide (TPR) repeat protein
MANRTETNNTEQSRMAVSATDAMVALPTAALPHANRFRKAAAALVSATVIASLLATGAAVQPEPQAYAATSSQTSVSQAKKNLDAAIATASTAKSNYKSARKNATDAINTASTAIAAANEAETKLATARAAYEKVPAVSQDAKVIETTVALDAALKTYHGALKTYDTDRAATETARKQLDTALTTYRQSPTIANLRALNTAIANVRTAQRKQVESGLALGSALHALTDAIGNSSSAVQHASIAYATNPAVTGYIAAADAMAQALGSETTAVVGEATAVVNRVEAHVNYVLAVIDVVNYQHDYNQAKAQQQATKKKGEADVSGSTYRKLKAKATKTTTSTVTVSWKKVSGATSYAIYANKCGKNTKMKYLTTVGSKTTSYTQRNRKKGTYYKYVVQALNTKGNAIATSKTVHAATTGGKVGNDASVKVAKTKKALKAGKYIKKLTLKKGKSATLHVKAVPQKKKAVKRHRGLRFESSKNSVVKVGAKSGKLTAKKKGTATVYCYTQNGKLATVKVTVK